MKSTREPSFSNAVRRAAVLGVFTALLFLPALALALAVSISQTSGTVEVRKASSSSWGTVSGPGHVLDAGDEVKTSRGSRAVVLFDDGSKIEIGPNGSFTLEEAQPARTSMRFSLGSMKAWVTKSIGRRFSVRTPTAVCSVRGTEFGVDVAPGGNTSVAVFSGLVGVGDLKGNEVLLSQGQRVDVTQAGITQKAQGASESGPDKTRQALKREVGLDMSKEEVQAAAANEIKSAVYQEGKAIIDVNGNRVRIEQYIIRPTPTSFKLVVLDERTDRFDYFYYQGEFNKNLPDDLSVALSQTQGQAITPPEFFQTAYETGRSNTIDKVVETATGGHLVDINNNGDNTDNVTEAFDSRLDGLVRIGVPNVDAGAASGNQSYWTTFYQNYDLKFNNVSHTSWVPAGGAPAFNVKVAAAGGVTGIQNYAGHIARTDVVNIVQPPACQDGERCTYEPQPGKVQFNIYRENVGGTVWDKFENYVISDEGKLAEGTAFTAVAGPTFKTQLMNWNYQQIVTASEFGGRKIDLAVSPRILIQAGLIR